MLCKPQCGRGPARGGFKTKHFSWGGGFKARSLEGDTPIPLALLGKGRVMFFLEQEGLVKEFTLPSVLALLARMESDDR